MVYLVLLGVLVLAIFLATKSFSTKPDKSTLVGLYLAGAVICFVFGTLMAIGGRLLFAVPAFLLGFAAVARFLQERRLFLWRSGAFAGEEKEEPEDDIPGRMTRAEAREVLGVPEGASRDEIRVAYKKLMLEHHPDKAGHDYFAKKVNAARDVLLGKK